MTKKFITLQPATYIDNLWGVEGGEVVEGRKLPYPFHVAEDGSIDRQDIWRGDPVKVIGFTRAPGERTLALYWREAWANPDLAVGKYVVTTDDRGTWSTHLTAIESVTVAEES